MTKSLTGIAPIVAATACAVYDDSGATEFALTSESTAEGSGPLEDPSSTPGETGDPAADSSFGFATGDGSATTSSASTSTGEETDGSTTALETSASVSSSTTEDPRGCGDGMISPGEQCDGDELMGFTCMSLGLNGGTLACDPVMCTFDTSMCNSTSGGTSS